MRFVYRFRMSVNIFIFITYFSSNVRICSADQYDCPPHLVDNNGDLLCFFVDYSKNVYDFDSASDYCASKGGTLPIVRSEKMHIIIAVYLAFPGDSAWLGLTCNADTDSWEWLDGEQVDYNKFAVDPGSCTDDSEGKRYSQDQKDRLWRLHSKDSRFDYAICLIKASDIVPEIPDICDGSHAEVDGICYFVDYNTAGDWQDVYEHCEAMGATLPVILNENQNLKLWDVVYGWYDTYWIGLVCDGNGFAWLDGSVYDFNQFTSENVECDPDKGYYVNNLTKWASAERTKNAPIYVCSKTRVPDPFTTSSLMTPISTSQTPSSEAMITTLTTSFETSTSTEYDTTSYTSANEITTIDEQSTIEIHSTTEEFTETTEITEIVSTDTPTGPTENYLPVWVIVFIVTCALAICVIVITMIIIGRRRIKHIKSEIIEDHIINERKLGPSRYLRYYELPRISDEWEIHRKFVSIEYMSQLGEGAFGSVYQGWVLVKNIPTDAGRSIIELSALNKNNDAVAVKMLHDSADSITERNFRDEIAIMKRIGYHERLVNILASVTLSKPVLLISEYCSNGDLLGFMRRRRNYMIKNEDDFNDVKIITGKKQLMFAVQIAYGLEYLQSRGFIHRDIAARNIMVDHEETCKIGDFGLTRAIRKEEEKYRSQGGKLPLKWMSPEAIEKYQFSYASDIWSYGVLLFEIVTLGGTPYSGWPGSELLSRLKRGDRMERPDNCNETIYQLMRDCWAENTSDRPTSARLRMQLGELLESVNHHDYYLKLNPKANYYVMESNDNE